MMPKFPFPYDLRTDAVRYRAVSLASWGHRSLRIYITPNYKKNRHVVGALHDPRTGTARWPHGDRAENCKVLAGHFGAKIAR